MLKESVTETKKYDFFFIEIKNKILNIYMNHLLN